MRLSCKKIFLFGALLIFFYFEFITYWMLPFMWLQLPNCSTPYCKKILLVADPQIIGPEWKKFILMDWIAVFDSDRYIKRTFLKAFNYLQPDIVVFLGDLMDQGYLASQSEYISYLDRLENIFKLPKQINKTKIIFIPGDNDVGGIDDILVPSSVSRFDKVFNQTDDSILIEFIEFCKANLMTFKMQRSKFIDKIFINVIRIALSHVPLIPKKSYFLNEIITLHGKTVNIFTRRFTSLAAAGIVCGKQTELKVVKNIRPHLIFSGHSHKSLHYTTHEGDLWTSEQSNILPQDTQKKVYQFQEGLIHEIIVPTCSYRMGVNSMGYGAAFIDTREMKMSYYVLWLPQRFSQLFIYLSIVFLVIAMELIRLCRRVNLERHLRNSSIYQLYTCML